MSGSDQVIVFVTGGPLTVSAFATPDDLLLKERKARHQRARQRRHPVHREIPAGKRRPRRPGTARPGEGDLQLRHHRLRKPPVGGDLPAEDVHRHGARFLAQLDHIVPRRRGGRTRPVVIERPHPGIAPNDVPDAHGRAKVLGDRPEQVVALLRRAGGLARRGVVLHVGGADQGEVASPFCWSRFSRPCF